MHSGLTNERNEEMTFAQPAVEGYDLVLLPRFLSLGDAPPVLL
jgi:hypothetical protein